MCLLERGNRMYLTERLNAAGWKIGWTEKFLQWGWQHLKLATCIARWRLRGRYDNKCPTKAERSQKVESKKTPKPVAAAAPLLFCSVSESPEYWFAFNTISWTCPPHSRYSTSIIITCSLNSAWQQCVYVLLKRNGPQHNEKEKKNRGGSDKSIYVGRFTRRRAFIRKKQERLSTHSITTEAENKLPE